MFYNNIVNAKGVYQYMDRTYVQQTIPGAGVQIIALNLLAAGTGSTNRQSRNVHMHCVTLTFIPQPLSNATMIPDPFFRASVVYDKQPNGAVPTYAQIYTSVDAAGAPFTAWGALQNISNQTRFDILWDKWFCWPIVNNLASPAASFSDMINQFTNITIPLELPTAYNGDTAAITDVSTGSLLLCLRNNTGSVLTFEYTSRLMYSDLRNLNNENNLKRPAVPTDDTNGRFHPGMQPGGRGNHPYKKGWMPLPQKPLDIRGPYFDPLGTREIRKKPKYMYDPRRDPNRQHWWDIFRDSL